MFMIIEPPRGKFADRRADYILGVSRLTDSNCQFYREDTVFLWACAFLSAGHAIEWMRNGGWLDCDHGVMIVPITGVWEAKTVPPCPYIPF